jgi:hypothetical protein
MAIAKKTPPLAEKPAALACPKCGQTNDTSGAKNVRVDLRPVLTAEVFAFPDALAEVNCLKCAACGYWICLDYRIELDDNPEIDLNPE